MEERSAALLHLLDANAANAAAADSQETQTVG